MAEENVLQSFLVALGVKVDEVQFRKGLESVQKIGKEIMEFAKVAVAAEVVAVAALGKIAKGFEDLYYSSKRTGSTAQEITGFSYAISQLGGSADEAVGALESLSVKLKANPQGFGAYLKGIGSRYGVDIDTAHGAAKAFEGLEVAFSRMNSTQQRVYADDLGWSEKFLNAVVQYKEIAKLQGESAAKAKAMGVDLQQAEVDGQALNQTFRSLGATFSVLGKAISADLFKSLTPTLEKLNAFILSHGKEIAAIVVEIAGALLKLFTALVEHLPDIEAFVKKIGGWDVVLALIGTALLTKFVPGLTALAGAMAGLASITAPAWLLAMLGLTAVGAEGALKGRFDEVFNGATGGPPTPETRAMQGEGAWTTAKRLWGRITGTYKDAPAGGGGGSAIGKAARSANALAVADEWRKAGLPAEGIAAAMGSAQSESGFNPRAYNGVKGGHTGLIQWDSVRWPKVAAWIKSQGGDPYDVRWQAKAFVAEGRAKPGDAIYDGTQTARGFRDLENAKGDIGRGISGMRGIERFGPRRRGRPGRERARMASLCQRSRRNRKRRLHSQARRLACADPEVRAVAVRSADPRQHRAAYDERQPYSHANEHDD